MLEMKIIYDVHNDLPFSKPFLSQHILIPKIFRKNYLSYVDYFIISKKIKNREKYESYNKKIYFRESMKYKILTTYKEILS